MKKETIKILDSFNYQMSLEKPSKVRIKNLIKKMKVVYKKQMFTEKGKLLYDSILYGINFLKTNKK